MNNKGFTLIELVAVVSLLAILASIITPKVFKMIEQNKENGYIETLESIVNAADVYVTEHRYDLTDDDSSTDGYQIKLLTLIDNGNLKSEIKNPINGESYDTNDTVTATLENKSFSYIISGDICTDEEDYTWLDIENENKYDEICSN